MVVLEEGVCTIVSVLVVPGGRPVGDLVSFCLL